MLYQIYSIYPIYFMYLLSFLFISSSVFKLIFARTMSFLDQLRPT